MLTMDEYVSYKYINKTLNGWKKDYDRHVMDIGVIIINDISTLIFSFVFIVNS